MKMNKLFFFDIDGTLISCNDGIDTIPKEVQSALDQLKQSGNGVFIATGRCPCFLLDSIKAYDFDGMVCCNGSLVIYRNQEVYKKVITKNALQKVKEFSDKYNALVYLEGRSNIYALHPDNPIHKIFIKDWGMKENTIITKFNINDIRTYIGMIVLNNESEIEIMNNQLSQYFDIQRHMHGLSFDLTLKGISKADGIEELTHYFNKEMTDTVAFGDGRNDLEMLERVNLGIAMGNASEETKSCADYITTDVKSNGIINALKHYKFIK